MLEAKSVSVNYGKRLAVANVSLRVSPGAMTAIVGANGAGKSSLLRALNGAIQPSGGEILLDGKPLRSFARRAIGRRIAVVTQEALLAFPVSVLEYVLGGRYAWSGSGAWGWESERDLEIAFEVLRQTELENFSGRLMNEFQEVSVNARFWRERSRPKPEFFCLTSRQPTWIWPIRLQCCNWCEAHCDERATAAVIVTHDINLAAEFADHVVLLKSGHMIADGPPREVLTEELLSEVLEIKVLVDAHPLSGAPRITPAHELRR